jgi:S1-C subfamily serine protease
MAKIDTTVLYSAVRLRAAFFNMFNEKSAGTGSGFIVTGAAGNRYLVTNRHVLDRNFRKAAGWTLESVTVNGHYQSTVMDILGTVAQQLTVTDPEPKFLGKPRS